VPSGVPISALPAVVTPADTDEFIVNQGGTSKKVTRAQLRPYSEVILATPNLVAYWPLDEVAGTRASDVVGGYHGTYISTPTLGEAGATGTEPHRSVRFNGSSQWVTMSRASALNPYPLFSVDAWIKVTTTSYQAICGWWDGSATNGWDMYVGGQNKLAGDVCGSSSLRTSDAGIGSVITDGVWHHVAMTATGTTLTLYVDGAVAGSPVTGTWTFSVNPTPQVPAIAGRGAADLPFGGTIKQVALYARNLTTAEVAAHYAAGIR
jgi:hypothetical protein